MDIVIRDFAKVKLGDTLRLALALSQQLFGECDAIKMLHPRVVIVPSDLLRQGAGRVDAIDAARVGLAPNDARVEHCVDLRSFLTLNAHFDVSVPPDRRLAALTG